MARKSVNSGLLFDLDKLKTEITELQAKSEKEDFWNDQKSALSVINKLNSKKSVYEKYITLQNNHKDLLELIELDDESLLDSLNESFDELKGLVNEFETDRLFTGEFDNLNAILEIHPGAGGTEAQDWADMLYRMYVLYAENHRFKMQLISLEPGEEAGLKSVTIKIAGKHAYGLLKSEKGVHRLVRISPFDANKRRHTSFASVNVIPEFTDNSINIEINDADLKIDTYRSGGAGGQNVCQIERSQLSNKETAMAMLKSKLYLLEVEKRNNELNSIVGEKKNIEWGSQIRSYVFCPYTLVKDNRTNYEETDVQSVMNGYIDNFLYEYLHMEAKNNA